MKISDEISAALKKFDDAHESKVKQAEKINATVTIIENTLSPFKKDFTLEIGQAKFISWKALGANRKLVYCVNNQQHPILSLNMETRIELGESVLLEFLNAYAKELNI